MHEVLSKEHKEGVKASVQKRPVGFSTQDSSHTSYPFPSMISLLSFPFVISSTLYTLFLI